jgi:hypothetical protein
MRLLWLPLCLLALGSRPLMAAEIPHAPASEEEEPDDADQVAEESTIIPLSTGVAASTQAVTPISEFPEKTPYDQALSELAQAKKLYAQGHWEAASDMGLQAYDDLLTIRGGRGKRNRKKRAKLAGQRYQAASVYMDASIAYVKSFVEGKGGGPEALEEGRARMEDLRDVAHDYPNLNTRLNRALEKLK